MTSKSPELLAELEVALREEHDARGAIEAAADRVCATLLALARQGVPSIKAATRVAVALGLPMDLASKKRIAATLRKRASRCCSGTRGHGNVASGSGVVDVPAASLSGSQKEADMSGRLIKRTITEEYIDEDPTKGPHAGKLSTAAFEPEEVEVVEEDGDEVDEDEEEEQIAGHGRRPPPRRRR